MKPLVIGTRGSALALKQTEIVAKALQSAHSGLEIEIKSVVTTGDKKQGTPAAAVGDKKDWIAELEQAITAGDIDLAVHSGKDVPVDIEKGTALVSLLE